ncbi:MAG: hypothetical protein QXH27_05695 [Candidatus Micrarchaeia archaeon]
MAYIDELIAAGFTPEQAKKLAEADAPHWKTLNAEEIRQRISELAKLYNTSEENIREIIVGYSPFVGYDHETRIKERARIYGVGEERIKEIVLKYPPFISGDHKRAMRELMMVANCVGLTREEVVEMVMKEPALPGYSLERYAAALWVACELVSEDFKPDRDMLNIFLKRYRYSPYVPGTNRLNMWQASWQGIKGELKLLVVMRKDLQRLARQRVKC